MEELNLAYEAYRIRGVSHLYELWCLSWYCRGKNLQPHSVSERLIKLFDELRSNEIEDENVAAYKKTMSSNTKSRLMRDRRLEALIRYCGVGLPEWWNC